MTTSKLNEFFERVGFVRTLLSRGMYSCVYKYVVYREGKRIKKNIHKKLF